MQVSIFTTILLLTSICTAAILDILSPRQSTNNTITESYLQEVCYPPVTNPTPPCQSIINIQTTCEPNGTSPLALEAHAQCMCTGSFFSDWEGCLACNTVHGARSPFVAQAFLTIITSASNILCTGTPTAAFAAIFSGLSAGSGVGEGSNQNTVASDRYPSQTAISLYFTNTRSQGPGTITGSATQATTVATTTSRVITTSSGGQTSSRSSGSGSATRNAATTSSSAGGAAQTGAWMGGLGMIAGGIVIAAL